MKQCPSCGADIADDAVFCTNCGARFAPDGTPYYTYQPPAHEHTHEFDPRDISDNKVYCMLPYLLSLVGVVIALLAGASSPYIRFHVRQALKFTVVSILLTIIALFFCWTVVVPIAYIICELVLLVLKIIAFFQVCSGRAVEPFIIRSLGFLK